LPQTPNIVTKAQHLGVDGLLDIIRRRLDLADQAA
jgi:hypothetical protein